jgi:hypothetical protein
VIVGSWNLHLPMQTLTIILKFSVWMQQWYGVFYTTLFVKVCQWFVAGQLFFPGTMYTFWHTRYKWNTVEDCVKQP